MSATPEHLGWTALLAGWMEFAAAAKAWPERDGAAWRRAVSPVITLQALTKALSELDRLAPEERPLARDRAEVLIDAAEADLLEAFGAVNALPDDVAAIVTGSRDALAGSLYAGLEELVWPGPGELVMPLIDTASERGTLAAMAPGTIVFPGEPVAWWTERASPIVEGCRKGRAESPRQVYRRFDEGGTYSGRALLLLHEGENQGTPMLIPILIDGERVGRFLLDAQVWERLQRNAGVVVDSGSVTSGDAPANENQNSTG